MAGEMRCIDLDAKTWCTREDVYVALLAALKAPAWHGHNLDALHDSIVTGSINKIEPPFSITISNGQLASGEAQHFMRKLADLFQDFVNEGCPVSFVVR